MTDNAILENDARVATRPTRLAEIVAAYAALFASLTTLFCCALPALLVLLGFGLTSVLTFFTAIPGWENFGVYEMWYFAVSGGLLAAGFYLAYFHQAPRNQNCEISEGGTESACSAATRWNRKLLWLSLSLYSLAWVVNTWGIGWMRNHGYFNH